MAHSPLIGTLVLGFLLAFVLGAIAQRLRISPIVGYLLAGVAIGPHTPGIIADQQFASQLAEVGVILLMFGVGLHFSLGDLLKVKWIALPGALIQMAATTLLGMGFARLVGWNPATGFVFGLAVSVASTVVLTRALQERRLIDTERGHIAVGWLVVQDLAMVVALVFIPALGGFLNSADAAVAPSNSAILITLGITLAKAAAFVALMLVVGTRVIPWILHYIAHTGSRELFRLGVLSIALGVAYGAATLFGISFALGAFFAGMILSESALSQRAAEESLPFRDAFAVLFFVAAGMLVDPAIFVRNPWPMLGTAAIILIFNPLVAFLIALAFRQRLLTAVTLAVSLAQIGEFSFILAALALNLNLLPEEGQALILAGATISIVLNPFLFAALGRLRPWLQSVDERGAAPRPAPVRPTPEALEPTALSGHAVVVGYGRVGSIVGERLLAEPLPFLVIEERREVAQSLRQKNIEVIVGTGAEARVLNAANLPHARWLFVAIPDGFEAGSVVELARKANPELLIIARAHSDAEVAHLTKHGASFVIMGEREIALGMIDHAFGLPKAARQP
ncbi:MAG TPA: YbaL family putative K(+) efflux transporter [Xanthobacteraceae bacterium]|nr:YbaL family putative K(+) efflux transporter [Xanthobacteraceae bacterium]